jgi:hypothetical protein
LGGDVERRTSMLILKIDVTASYNELLRDGRRPYIGLEVERGETTIC